MRKHLTIQSSGRSAQSRVAIIHALEPRTFLSASSGADSSVMQIDFSNFATTEHLVGNGFGATPINSGQVLRLTDNAQHEARSVWFDTPVPISQFNTDFSFVGNANPESADGLTFTIQNGATSAVGADGLDLGYTGIPNSTAAAVNMYNFGVFNSTFGFANNGERPQTTTDLSPIDLHSGHRFRVTLRYDGSTLGFSLRDASDSSKVFTATRTIDIPGMLKSDTAIVGFTASTGAFVAVQDIRSWDFSGAARPSIAQAAAADPNPVPGTSTTLSILGDDLNGEDNLTYTWRATRVPSGGKLPRLSVNGTNAAKSTVATFSKSGTYRFRCTVRNEDGLTASSDVSVVVNQTGTAMKMSPHRATVPRGTTLDFDATVLDQFGRTMRTQPSIVFSVDGPGTIDPLSGLFTASKLVKGHVEIHATAGDVVGMVGATVT